ncbi:MAG: rhomboid family intramembrane serine protease [Actinomycetota bacterium]|nr:rhomboid family intramembrane serine protease [Actinomycetota bacterium]
MTPTSVGMRCPECSREKTKVRTARHIQRATEPVVTYTLIAVNVIAYLAEGSSGSALAGNGLSGTLLTKGWLYGPDISVKHEYYRLLTSGFLHLSFQHVLFNMVFIFFLGRMLEPALGRLNFAVLYLASLLAGSFGALLFSPGIPTVGASGAAFGVLAAAIVVAYDRRIPIWSSGLGITLVINIVFSVTVSNISIGGHIGGFFGGLICGAAIVRLGERRGQKWVALGVCALVAVAGVAGAIAVAGQTGLTPHGLTL